MLKETNNVMEKVINLLKSKLKIKILTLLKEERLTPTLISKLLKKPRASISRVVLELKELKYVRCVNPKADRWRIYEITKQGKEMLKKVKRFF